MLKNNENQTVSIILSSNGILPSCYWMHDINIKDKYGNSIKSNLEKYNYVYINGKLKYGV